MRDTGTGRLGATYNVTNYTPLDTRQLVPTYDDLLLAETWTVEGLDYTYNGMFVVVGSDDADKNGIYRLFDANNPGADDAPNYKLASSWHKVAEVSDLDNIKATAEAIASRVATLEGKVEALEGASGGVDEDAVNDLIEAQLTTLKAELDAKYASKTDLDNFYTKSEVDTKIDEAIAGGEVDLSSYYNKSEADNKFADKEIVEQHINEYEAQVNTNLASINALQSKHTTELSELDGRVDNLEESVDNIQLTVYTPEVSDEGDLSWTNNGGLANPETVNIKGPEGQPGSDGKAATIKIGSVTTVTNASATVTNSGTDTDAILNFEIPRGAPGSTISKVLIEDADQIHLGEIKWSTTADESKYMYTGDSVIIEPEFECAVEDTQEGSYEPYVEVDFNPDESGSYIKTDTINTKTVFKPQYKMKFGDIAPKIHIGKVTYKPGEGASASINKLETNEYNLNLKMPMPQGKVAEIEYSDDKNPVSSVDVDATNSNNPTISVTLKNPIIADGGTVEMTNWNGDPITVDVTQTGNKVKFDFHFPNILDDGELA